MFAQLVQKQIAEVEGRLSSLDANKSRRRLRKEGKVDLTRVEVEGEVEVEVEGEVGGNVSTEY